MALVSQYIHMLQMFVAIASDRLDDGLAFERGGFPAWRGHRFRNRGELNQPCRRQRLQPSLLVISGNPPYHRKRTSAVGEDDVLASPDRAHGFREFLVRV